MGKTLEKHTEIERSIIKKFRKTIWNNFIGAVKEYELIAPGDKIAVCISGGKDSMLLAKCIQQLQRHSEIPFEAEYIVMDPGYNAENRALIEHNAKLMDIPIYIFESDIFSVTERAGGSPCYLCARMRRGCLYSKAKDLGCNKIALGHHFNDVIETVLMSMMYSSEIKTMPPKLHSTNFEGMELIRPMYCIHEEDVVAWRNYNNLEFIQCACRFTEKYTLCSNEGGISKRQEIKQLIKTLKAENPLIEKSIFNSIHSVCLDTMLGYKFKGVEHSFLDDYDSV